MVVDPNQAIQDLEKKMMADIIISGKLSILSYGHMLKLLPICQRSVWDQGSDIENRVASEEDKEEDQYESDQEYAMLLADGVEDNLIDPDY